MTKVNELVLLRDFILYNPHLRSEAKVAEFENLALWLVDDILSDTKSRRVLEAKIRYCGCMDNKCSQAAPCALTLPGVATVSVAI